ncbi:MAG: iron transporter [Actinomyces sp.]|nr:iron transporter [Actinomyces sp.]
MPGYVGQQVPSPPQAEYLPQEAMQPVMQQSWGQMPGEAGMQAGFPQPGPGVYGPAVPARRRTSYKLAVILLVVGLLFAVSPFLAEGFIGLIPGDHGDGGDGLLWLGVIMLFYLTPLGLILILISAIVAIVVAVMNSSSKS